MERSTKKTIGVLGGIGPGASANLYNKIIEYMQQNYNAVQDFDYPPVIIYSLPLTGFSEKGIEDESSVKTQLTFGVRKLEDAGSDLIIIACNTVHEYYKYLQKQVSIPIFNIIEETKKRVSIAGYTTVGLFSSESTNKLKLYQKSFLQSGIGVICANDHQQNNLNAVIEHVMGGRHGERDIIMLKEIARDFISKGAQAIVLGCTEIPLAINQTHTDIKLFDTIRIIVECAVDYSLGKK